MAVSNQVYPIILIGCEIDPGVFWKKAENGTATSGKGGINRAIEV